MVSAKPEADQTRSHDAPVASRARDLVFARLANVRIGSRTYRDGAAQGCARSGSQRAGAAQGCEGSGGDGKGFEKEVHDAREEGWCFQGTGVGISSYLCSPE